MSSGVLSQNDRVLFVRDLFLEERNTLAFSRPILLCDSHMCFHIGNFFLTSFYGVKTERRSDLAKVTVRKQQC